MPSILLYIREPGRPDIAEKYRSRGAAREALFDYVKENWRFDDVRCPTDVAKAIEIFFARSPANYVIAEIEGGPADASDLRGDS